MSRDKSESGASKLPKGVIAVSPPSFRRERALIKRGVWPVAGCDEAGRGPLAGPVVAAAVVLDPKRIPKGIDDSKRLTPEEREDLFEKICATSSFAVAFASPARIDRDNILRASLWALARRIVRATASSNTRATRSRSISKRSPGSDRPRITADFLLPSSPHGKSILGRTRRCSISILKR